MNWEYFNKNKNYLSKDLSLKVFTTILMTQNIFEATFVTCVWDLLTQKKLLVLRGLQGTSFPFQNLIDVEIGLIEEPNFTLETLQTFKKLDEGVDTEVAVKFKLDQLKLFIRH